VIVEPQPQLRSSTHRSPLNNQRHQIQRPAPPFSTVVNTNSGEHFGGDIAAAAAREIIHKSLHQLGVAPEQKPYKTSRIPAAPRLQ